MRINFNCDWQPGLRFVADTDRNSAVVQTGWSHVAVLVEPGPAPGMLAMPGPAVKQALAIFLSPLRRTACDVPAGGNSPLVRWSAKRECNCRCCSLPRFRV